MNILIIIMILIGAYLIGSIPTGYLAGKLIKGIDIRQYGSQNVGATNVFRIVGKTAGVVVLIIDMLKGMVPLLLASYILPSTNIEVVKIMTGLATICGHNWTLFLGFKGGKGVATSTGVLLFLSPLATLTAVLIFILTVTLTKYISIGSIFSAIAMPYLVLWFYPGKKEFLLFVSVLAVVIIIKHKANIHRLLCGLENRFSFKSKEQM